MVCNGVHGVQWGAMVCMVCNGVDGVQWGNGVQWGAVLRGVQWGAMGCNCCAWGATVCSGVQCFVVCSGVQRC